MTGPRITRAKRGAVKAFREYLNKQFADSPKWRNYKFHQKTRGYGDYLYFQDRDMFENDLGRAMEGSSEFPGWDRDRWLKPGNETLPVQLPTARSVRDVLGHVDVGCCRVSYDNRWGDERFPWVVYGPVTSDDMRDRLEEFPQYKQAIQFAKSESEKHLAAASTVHG